VAVTAGEKPATAQWQRVWRLKMLARKAARWHARHDVETVNWHGISAETMAAQYFRHRLTVMISMFSVVAWRRKNSESLGDDGMMAWRRRRHGRRRHPRDARKAYGGSG